jgi:hypothetical protein
LGKKQKVHLKGAPPGSVKDVHIFTHGNNSDLLTGGCFSKVGLPYLHENINLHNILGSKPSDFGAAG